jgi:hypothetical protein
MTATTINLENAQLYRPGFLFSPLGWLNERLAKPLAADPALFAVLFELDPYHMHLLGLGLAHRPAEPSPTIVRSLIVSSPQAVLAQVIGQYPPGLSRALRQLPDVVLPANSYRALLGLLTDRPTATYLHHCRSIDGSLIAGLAALPSQLRRPAIFKLFDKFEGMDRFVHGLRFLSGRAGIAFDILIGQLACLDQNDQVIARIIDLVDGLPLPDGLPKPDIGSFARIDGVAEIKAIAKDWANCLAEHLHDISVCTGAIYASINDGPPAVAFAGRVDRLGWGLHQIKGPKNADLDPIDLVRHQNAFGEAGIPMFADIAAIRDLVLRSRWPRHLDD